MDTRPPQGTRVNFQINSYSPRDNDYVPTDNEGTVTAGGNCGVNETNVTVNRTAYHHHDGTTSVSNPNLPTCIPTERLRALTNGGGAPNR